MKIKNTFKALKLVVTASAFTLVSGYAFSNVVVSPDAAIQGTAGAAGLAGSFWWVAYGSTKINVATAESEMTTNARTGTFVAKTFNYSGIDNTSIQSFLGSDGSSYSGSTGYMNDGILDMKGFVHVAAPSTLVFNSNFDDGLKLTVGGATVIYQGGNGGQAVYTDFSKAGYYAVDLMYFNTAQTYGGNANLKVYQNINNFYQAVQVAAVPEPETYAMLLAGLSALGFAARRRKSL